MIAGANPLRALQGLLAGAFGDGYAVAETLVQSVPIAIVALGVAPALRAGIFPVGSEGQLAIGAVTATATILAMPAAPAIVALPMGCMAGVLGGDRLGVRAGAPARPIACQRNPFHAADELSRGESRPLVVTHGARDIGTGSDATQ